MADADLLAPDQPPPGEPAVPDQSPPGERPVAERNEVIEAIIKQAKGIREYALYCHLGHGEDARWQGYLHRLLGVPTTVIAAAAGATSLTGVQAGTNPGPWQSSIWPPVIAAILAFSVAVLSALMTFLDPKAQSADHYRASSAFDALRTEVEIFYRIDCRRNTNGNALVERLNELDRKFAELVRGTPDLSFWATNGAEELLKDWLRNDPS